MKYIVTSLVVAASLMFAYSGLSVPTDGSSFRTSSPPSGKENIPKNMVRVTRTCDIGPKVMNVAVCPRDSLCKEEGRLQQGQSQDFKLDEPRTSHSVKGFNFAAGGGLFDPCRAFGGDEVEIFKSESGLFGAKNCFCRTVKK